MNLLYLPKIDIYTGLRLTRNTFSKEHIIPGRFFLNKKDSNDIYNLAPCHRAINSARSDLRFGNICHKPFIEHDRCGIIDYKRRTFYPGIHTDKGLIARSIIHLLSKYPYLYTHLNDIVDCPETLSIWNYQYSHISEFEYARNQFILRK